MKIKKIDGEEKNEDKKLLKNKEEWTNRGQFCFNSIYCVPEKRSRADNKLA